MRTCLTFVAKSMAFVCAVSFVIVAVLALLLFNIEWQLLHAPVYQHALLAVNVYERFPALAAEMLVRSATFNPCAENPDAPECQSEGQNSPEESPGTEESGGPPEYLKSLTAEQWEAILSNLLPAPWLKTQTESVLDQVFTNLDSEAATLTITVSLVEVKARLTGPEGLQAALTLLNGMPPCTQAELAAIGQAGPEAGPEAMPSCRPPEKMLDQIAPQIEKTLGELAARLPDELHAALPETATPTGGASSDGGGPLANNPRASLRFIRWGMRFSPLAAVGLLALVTLFGVRSFKDFLRWWGMPLLMVGLMGGGLALAAAPLTNWALATLVADKIPGAFTPNVVQAGFDVGRQVVRALARPIGLEAGMMAAVGLVMLVAAPFLRTKPGESESVDSQPPSAI